MAAYPRPGARSPIFGTPQVPQGILGLDPQTIAARRRQQQFGTIGDTLTSLGIGLMGQGPTTTPQSPLQGLAAGLQGAQQLSAQRQGMQQDQQRMDLAQGQYGMQQQQFQAEMADRQAKEAMAKARTDQMESLIADLPPEQQSAARADPDTFFKAYADSMFPKEQGPQSSLAKLAADLKAGRISQPEYDAAVRKENYIPSQQGSDTGYFGNPIPGTDEQGKPAILVLGKDGQLHVAKTPDGATVAPPLQWLNTGTGFTPVPTKGGQTTGGAEPVPIDVSGEASAKTQGGNQGQAASDLPTAENNAATALKELEAIRTSPGISTGAMSVILNKIPGTEWKGFQLRVNQAKSGAFLQAYNSLRGGGNISNAEGEKAEAALARLDTAQTRGDFLAALDDFQAVIKNGLEVARKKAAAPTSTGGQDGGGGNDPLGIR